MRLPSQFLTVCCLLAALTSCGGGSSTDSVTNTAPVAQAGSAQNVTTGTLVTLDASASSDANDDTLTYRWSLSTKPASSAAALSSTGAVKPTFTPDVAGVYVLTLVVNDGMVDSASATVTVTATAPVTNTPPVAQAGSAQSVVLGSTVTLDGSASSDANGDTLSYAWKLSSLPSGSSATLSNALTAKPSFTPDVAGAYVASLIVWDGKVLSAPATVTITVTAQVTPLPIVVPTYPVVDTGQTLTYNLSASIAAPTSGQAFYGQDAQFNGTQPSYTLSADGKTVKDNITGLTWMRGPNTTLAAPVSTDKKSYSAAQAWVSTVNAMAYGGYSDWRLPSIKELYSLMSFKGTDPSSYSGSDTSVLTPFIDSTYFNFAWGQTSAGERIIDSQYASSNVFVASAAQTGYGYGKLFGLNLADGRIKGYDFKMALANGSTIDKTFFVQLVRGVTTYPNNSFTDNKDGTVSDKATGLMWSQNDSATALSWEQALAWVQTKNAAKYLGYSDWRLPNAKELHSLVNYANAPDYNNKPAIDTTVFNTSQITNENGVADYPYFWTSTTHGMYTSTGSSGTYAVYIGFGRCLGYPSDATRWVDIHGAGCQRSDPKATPPYGAPATTKTTTVNGVTYTGYSNGPQGDALRGYNYVRLVRTAS